MTLSKYYDVSDVLMGVGVDMHIFHCAVVIDTCKEMLLNQRCLQ